jgi:hypothetical protein
MIQDVLNKIQADLDDIFGQVFDWCRADMGLLDYVPHSNGWTIRLVLEHISITNHFLLILIRKGAAKAIERAAKGQPITAAERYDLNWDKLAAIGQHGAFEWNRPQHMEPTGLPSLETIRQTLQSQLAECQALLNQLRQGEGVLYKTQMSVNGLGKIDVYHYIYFLALHAQRHIQQMEKIQDEFKK